MNLKSGNSGEVIPGRKEGRAKGMSICIVMALVVMVVVAGCLGGEKKEEDHGQTPQKTPEAAIFSIKKSDKEAPKTPITLSMSMPAALGLNTVSNINITVNSVLDAPNTKIDLILPEGASLVSGESTWEVNLTANTPATFSAKIMITKTGNWEIKAIAKRVIDQENIWGDMDIAYIGYQPVNATQAAREQK